MAATALALGLFFDRPIIEDLGLVDAVLELSLGGGPSVRRPLPGA